MSVPGRFRLEAAGWGFWLVTCLVLAGPCVYVSYQITAEHLSREIPFTIGIIGAVILGAFVTFIANTVLQRVNARRKAAERRQAGPANKKKKR
ncbi:MAG: hypothetical protein FJY92_01455 [Candidatus Hydrogenedentes bacterium]|nr:hypothetical protein [Candidatus Hydrogenedentota bacterium]